MDVYDASAPSRSARALAYDGHDSGEKITLSSTRHEYDRENRPPKRTTPSSRVSSSSFHDGRPVLPGFILSDKPVAEDTW